MNEQRTINVVVVDDHPFMRVGVSAILRSQSDMSVVGEAASAAEAIDAYRQHVPDLVVIDLGLPDDSGLNVIRSVRSRYPNARFVVLTNSEGDEDIHQALTAGARRLRGEGHGPSVAGRGGAARRPGRTLLAPTAGKDA